MGKHKVFRGLFASFILRTVLAWVFVWLFPILSSAGPVTALPNSQLQVFTALRGVTVDALPPSAMDAIRGTGSVHIGFWGEDRWNHWDWVAPRFNAGPWNVWVRLEKTRGGKLTLTRD